MWKIKIVYEDESKCTITGKHKDIPLELAVEYFNQYVSCRRCSAVYQQYPMKEYPAMDLLKKIDELENTEE